MRGVLALLLVVSGFAAGVSCSIQAGGQVVKTGRSDVQYVQVPAGDGEIHCVVADNGQGVGVSCGW